VLPAIRVPTLIIHNVGDRAVPVEGSRYMAARIPGAKYVELPGVDHVPFSGNSDTILDEIEEFLTGVRRGPEPDRVLATMLFTDIVDSTRKASELGDRRCGSCSTPPCARPRAPRPLPWPGRLTPPAMGSWPRSTARTRRASRLRHRRGCQAAGARGARGLHTGECEVSGSKLTGIAVHIGARIAGIAKSGEVLVSNTVKDLVAGSGLKFDDRGLHTLKGVPGEAHLFAVDRGGTAVA